MDVFTLQKRLLEAYTVQNLNKISLTLIDLYKNGQYEILKKIAEIISDYTLVEMGEYGKGFSKFMMLYHPDRVDFHVNEINRIANEGNFDELLCYGHILKLEHIEEIASSLSSYEDIDYSPVYEWDVQIEGFRLIANHERYRYREQHFNQREKRYSFYDAIKIRYYGHTNQEYPTYYLEDTDEIELAASGINNLDGVQYCIHTRIFDLSDNFITDLSLFSNLTEIEELDLSENEISDIDILGQMTKLNSLKISNNKITDIACLLNLDNLDYIDLSDNKIPASQIKMLKKKGVEVIE